MIFSGIFLAALATYSFLTTFYIVTVLNINCYTFLKDIFVLGTPELIFVESQLASVNSFDQTQFILDFTYEDDNLDDLVTRNHIFERCSTKSSDDLKDRKIVAFFLKYRKPLVLIFVALLLWGPPIPRPSSWRNFGRWCARYCVRWWRGYLALPPGIQLMIEEANERPPLPPPPPRPQPSREFINWIVRTSRQEGEPVEFLPPPRRPTGRPLTLLETMAFD